MENENVSKNFIEQMIDKDIEEGHCKVVHTRFPPEPNGYLHIGHAKSILLNYGLAQKYGGKFNLRFDDTNPTKEKTEFVEAITEDIKWLGADWEGRLFFASDYFDQMYECAVELIKKGKAYVSDLSAEQIREYRGTLTEPGKEDPYSGRSVEENLKLFEEMREGKYADGEKVLRARIDMSSSNINMRDPVIYRVAHMTHHRTGDKWCIYPMYDFAHPLEDAIEGITHSICTLEFEDHRPLYEWVINEVGAQIIPDKDEMPPRQIEFAKLYLTNVVTGKRYIKRLVEEGIVDGWDDPRLVSIAALRRRGFTPESLKMFVELCGISKANSSVDYAMLEYCIREDLKMKKSRMMAVLDPVKVVIDNYPEGQTEYLDVVNNLENEALGVRKIPFSGELYIEREDFMEEPPKKYFRMFPGNEVRLMGAYFVKCTGCEKDENGNVVIDPETGKPKKDPKTMQPYTVLDDIYEIEALPETTEKEIAYKNFRREAIKPYRQMRMPQPDFVLCCNNICNCMTKWYENIARMCDIPLIMIDIPYNNTVEVDDTYVAYIRGQFDNAIHDLEKLTGKKFDEKKFDEACANANRTAKAWLKVCDYLQYKPAPYSGFDLFNHMADVVTARGKVAAAEAFELLEKDLEEAVKNGTSTTPFPEKYRVMFEGIPCWPKLPNLFKPLKEHGVNVTAVVYAPAFGFVYNNMDEMVRAYYKAPNSVCIEQGVDWREGICRDNKVDGVLVHYNRSCKPWSGYMAEMQRRFTKDLGVPCAGFDGDQADPRNFNEAQYETRVQGLVEAMEANKAAKEAAEK